MMASVHLRSFLKYSRLLIACEKHQINFISFSIKSKLQIRDVTNIKLSLKVHLNAL